MGHAGWIATMALVFAVGCKSKDKEVEKKAPPTPEPTTVKQKPMPKPKPTTPPPELPPVEATKEALVTVFADLVKAEGDAEKAIAGDLELPDPSRFFADTFGPEVGLRLVEAYVEDQLLVGIAKTVRYNQNAHERRKVQVEKFTSADDRGATGLQARALKAMVKPVPLYSIRFSAPNKPGELHLSSFIHDGKRFRYVGPLIALESKAPTKSELDRLRRRQGKK